MLRKRYSSGQTLKSAARDGDSDEGTPSAMSAGDGPKLSPSDSLPDELGAAVARGLEESSAVVATSGIAVMDCKTRAVVRHDQYMTDRARPDSPSSTPSPPGRGSGRGFQLGTIAGIPIFASTSWLIVALILVISYAPVVDERISGLALPHTYLIAIGFVAVLFGSVLAHELGHALTARRLGVPVDGMTLWALGGFTQMRREPPTPGREFAIAGAGPGVSVLLGGLGTLAYLPLGEGIAAEFAWQLGAINIVLAIFNLLPGLPLDGGSLVRAGVWALTGNRPRATVFAAWSGRVVAVAVAVLGAALAWSASTTGYGISITGLIFTIFVCVFLWFGATTSLRMARLTVRAARLTVRELARPVVAVEPATPLAQALEAAGAVPNACIIVVDADGQALGIVSDVAIAATPPERRPWVSVSELSHTVTPEMVLTIDTTGEQLIAVLSEHPAPAYLVTTDGQPTGVVVTSEAVAMLDSAR